jgi:acylphosphatase
MKSSYMDRRVHVIYSGMVQGVGFRYTAMRIAAAANITGWVRNLRDGRVEIVAEGEEKKLNQFLNDIKKGSLGYYIRGVDVQWEDYRDEFGNFDVRF